MGDSWNHEFDYQIPFHEANFVFHYPMDRENHFIMLNNKPFGYIYTDYEEGGALSVSGDFFLISWSYEFQNSSGNLYDMKCIEEPGMMGFYNTMEILGFEVWCANTSAKFDISEGKIKSELKKAPWFKSVSPYNLFRENLVFEVSDQLTLSHVALQILGRPTDFVKYPSIEDKYSSNQKISELFKADGDPIIDLIYTKEPSQPTEQTVKPD